MVIAMWLDPLGLDPARPKEKSTNIFKQSVGSLVVSEIIDFLNGSPTAFHAVDKARKRLEAAGYERISEKDDWKIEAGKKYFFTRNFSTIIAFAIGKKYVAGNGFHIVGAHTDSPCLKLKPVSKVSKGGYLEVGVQTYGAGLWHTWFDRDLTIAGRVIIRESKDGAVSYSHRLVRIKDPIMRIPTLAIHLDRGVDDGFKVNTHSHLVPVLETSIKAELNKTVSENTGAEEGGVKGKKLLAVEIGCEPHEICDFDLQTCDTQPSVVAGAMKEFIFSGRLDNLCMAFCSLKDKHEENHQPQLHGGLGWKIANRHNLPIQDFVVRNDMPCGSTIGPILASGVGIRTVDMGAPQLSMHSIREMCAVDDAKQSHEHFKAYFEEFQELDRIGVDL
uniref:Aspartyl aminopeptidase n=1 Tax=Kalanchoe fedtschenkoi TaxID=63787 RepID=A0A7N0RIU5_KALFE